MAATKTGRALFKDQLWIWGVLVFGIEPLDRPSLAGVTSLGGSVLCDEHVLRELAWLQGVDRAIGSANRFGRENRGDAICTCCGPLWCWFCFLRRSFCSTPGYTTRTHSDWYLARRYSTLRSLWIVIGLALMAFGPIGLMVALGWLTAVSRRSSSPGRVGSGGAGAARSQTDDPTPWAKRWNWGTEVTHNEQLTTANSGLSRVLGC